MCAQKLAEGAKGGTPPSKQGQKIDLRIAHWSTWAPRTSGLYETCRELIAAENQIEGVLAGMCVLPPPKATKSVEKKYIEGGFVDPLHPELRTQDWGWGMKFADVHVIHYSFDKRLGKLEPLTFFSSGTFEACLQSSFTSESRSLLSAAEWIDRFKATFVTSRRAHMYWSVFDAQGDKLHIVDKGIDLEWWQRTMTRRELKGKPSVLYGEIWRGIKHPAQLLYAINEIYKENEDVKLNAWSLNRNRDFWVHMLRQANFNRFLGLDPILGRIEYPEHFYSRGDLLVSPVLMGDVSRVHAEAMACGCPVVSWDSDPRKDNHPYKYARAFDEHDLAEKIMQTYEEVLDDREKVAKKCRATAEKYFNINNEAKQIVDVLRRVVNEFR